MDKDIHRWEIPPKVLKDIDRETLLTHKPLAFELMFPKVGFGMKNANEITLVRIRQ